MKKSPTAFHYSLSLARAGSAFALVILLLGATAPRLAAQSDNFNDGNDTAGVAWTHYSLTLFGIPYGGTTYSFPDDGNGGKAYSLSAAATGTDPYGVKNARGGSYVKTNTYTTRFSVGTDLLAWSTVGRPTMGVLWYLHDIGLGTSDGYVGSFSPNYGNIYISIATNEAQQAYCARLQDGDITLNATNRIRMVASSHDGYTFVLTVYNLLEPNTPWASAIGQEWTWYNSGGYSGYILMNEDYPTNYGASATFDNYVATLPAEGTMPAMLTDVYPPPAGKTKSTYVYVTNSVTILNRDTSVDPSSILLCLDGVWIPNASLTIDYQVYKQYNPSPYPPSFGGATATYAITNVLPWGSKHTNVVVFSDSTTWFTNTWTWTVAYNYLFASNSLPVGSLSVPGFDARMVQSSAANIGGSGGLNNSVTSAKAVLAYQYAVDLAATNIVQEVAWGLHANEYGAVTNFPGLCIPPANVNSYAIETLAYLQLTAGVHRFYVDSDDAVGVYSGTNLTDTSMVLLENNGVTHKAFDFAVAADGLYPFHVIYEEGTGAAYLVLNSVNLDDSSTTLVNAAGGVSAFYPLVCRSSTSVAGPYTVDAAANAGNALTTADVLCGGTGAALNQKVTGGTLTVPISGPAKFYRLDGPRKTKITNITKSGSNVVITYQFL